MRKELISSIAVLLCAFFLANNLSAQDLTKVIADKKKTYFDIQKQVYDEYINFGKSDAQKSALKPATIHARLFCTALRELSTIRSTSHLHIHSKAARSAQFPIWASKDR